MAMPCSIDLAMSRLRGLLKGSRRGEGWRSIGLRVSAAIVERLYEMGSWQDRGLTSTPVTSQVPRRWDQGRDFHCGD